MPVKADGATRADILKWAPEALEKIVLGKNPSRANLTADLRVEELALSIAEKGQLEPGIVRRESGGAGVLIAGFRRLAAVKLINQAPERYGLKGPMPFLASLVTCTDEEALELNLIENLQRVGLDPVDRAYSARDLGKLGWTHERISGVMDCSGSAVGALLSLLELPARTLRAVAAGKMTEAAARGLRGLPEEEVLALTEEIEGGAKPAAVLKRVREARRAKGATIALSLAEAKRALEAQGSDQAVQLLSWLQGTDTLESCQLVDLPAVARKSKA